MKQTITDLQAQRYANHPNLAIVPPPYHDEAERDFPSELELLTDITPIIDVETKTQHPSYIVWVDGAAFLFPDKYSAVNALKVADGFVRGLLRKRGELSPR